MVAPLIPVGAAAAVAGLLSLLSKPGTASAASPDDLVRNRVGSGDDPGLEAYNEAQYQAQHQAPAAAMAAPVQPSVETLNDLVSPAAPVPQVQSSPLPRVAASMPQRRPSAAQPAAAGGPAADDYTFRANLDGNTPDMRATEQSASAPIDGHSMLEELLPLLGVMARGGGPAPQAQIAAPDAQRALPAPAGQRMITGPAAADAEAAALHDGGLNLLPQQTQQKFLPREVQGPPEEQGPKEPYPPGSPKQGPSNEEAVGPHAPAAKPDASLSITAPEEAQKTFSVGGRTYFADKDGNIYDESGKALGRASSVFRTSQLRQLKNLGLLGRVVK